MTDDTTETMSENNSGAMRPTVSDETVEKINRLVRREANVSVDDLTFEQRVAVLCDLAESDRLNEPIESSNAYAQGIYAGLAVALIGVGALLINEAGYWSGEFIPLLGGLIAGSGVAVIFKMAYDDLTGANEVMG